LKARRSLQTIAALKILRFRKASKLGALLNQTACNLENSRTFETAALLKLNAFKSHAILSRCALMLHIPQQL